MSKRPVHPGEVLREEFMTAEGLTWMDMCIALNVAPSHLSKILNGKCRISPRMALQLERRFGATAEFWMNLQTNYDLAMLRAGRDDK